MLFEKWCNYANLLRGLAGAWRSGIFFLLYNNSMDDDDAKDLAILDSELADSEPDSEELLACGN